MHIEFLQNYHRTLEDDIAKAIVYHECLMLKEQLQSIHYKLFILKEKKLLKYELSECA